MCNPVARELYERVVSIAPEIPAAVLGLALTAHALEEYENAAAEHKRLTTMSPLLAERYTYLAERSTGVTRATDAMQWGENVVCGEE